MRIRIYAGVIRRCTACGGVQLVVPRPFTGPDTEPRTIHLCAAPPPAPA